MEPKTINFTVYGEPCAKGRPKFTTFAGRVRAVTPQKTANYENLVKLSFAQQSADMLPDGMPLFALIDCYFAIPQSASQKKREAMIRKEILPIKRPDWDNVGKVVCDALNKVAYHDDSAIVDSRVRKFYSEQPRVEVTLSTMPIYP